MQKWLTLEFYHDLDIEILYIHFGMLGASVNGAELGASIYGAELGAELRSM